MLRLRMARLKNRFLRFRLKNRELSPAARLNLCARDQLDARRPARDYTYVVLDLETTGLDKAHDRIVSMGAFRIKDRKIWLGHMFNRLVNPKRDIPPEAIKIHGIVPDMVQDAPGAMAVLDEFLEFIGNSIIVAHHAAFDLHFINRLMMAKYGFAIQNLVLDTHPLSQRQLMPKTYLAAIRLQEELDYNAMDPVIPQNYFGLDAITSQLGIKVYQRHSAIGDALAAAMIFQRILFKIEKNGKGTLASLIKNGGV